MLNRKSVGWLLLVLLCAAAVWTAGCRDQSSDTPTAGPVSPTPTATALPVSAAPPTPTAGPVSPTPTATALSVSAAPAPNVVPASPTPAPDDNEPPTITSGLPSGWVYYPDHRTGWVSDYDATDPDGDDITWSLEGNDRHAFRIDSSGVLIFRSSPEHYNPTDSDQDNVYNLVVVATDNGTPSKSAKREVNPGFPILGVFRLKGQPKRDSGSIVRSCKASQSPVYPIRDAFAVVEHPSCPSSSSSCPLPVG